MPSQTPRRRLGNFGEAAAAAFLIRQGYSVLERQWRCGAGEIDLIARQGDQLVFVEVRTRRGAADGSAEESVTAIKQARLIRLAYTYLDTHSLSDTMAWRIDVITIAVDRAGRVSSLNHIVNAVEA